MAPVLYVNQEMVLRLGAVTGVGHARLILERFGRFWGAFSVIDLFLLNGLTIVTEFIGINLALGYLGVPRPWGVIVAAGVIIAAASTGSFRRFERFSLALCFFSLLLIPVFMLAHPPLTEIGRDLLVPRIPGRRQTIGRHAAGDRHRRHHHRAMATVLSAELCHRQAHHAAFHGLREGRPADRHRRRADRRHGHDGVHRRRVSRARRSSASSPTPGRSPRVWRPMPDAPRA